MPLCSLSGFGSTLASMLLKQVSDRVDTKQKKATFLVLHGFFIHCCRDTDVTYILSVSFKVWGSSGVEPDGSVSEGGRRRRGHLRITSMAGQCSSPLHPTPFLAVVLLCRQWLWFSVRAQP